MIFRDNPDKTAIIDSDSLIYSVGFSAEDKEEKIAIARMAERLEEMLFLELGVEKYEGYLTGSGNFRVDIAVTAPYKGNRSGTKPKHYSLLREYLQDAWGFVVVDGEEADDRVAARATGLGRDCIIVSIDKDLLTVPGNHYNWQKQEVHEVSKETALKNFYRQILTGDRIDHVLGIRGIGPKKADKILEGCTSPAEYLKTVTAAFAKVDEASAQQRVEENAKLLWMCRNKGEVWYPGIEDKYLC